MVSRFTAIGWATQGLSDVSSRKGPKHAAGKARRHSAGLIIFDPDRRVLLLRAYRYWDFPKGAVEPGESVLQAATREAEEETGPRALRFPWGEPSYTTEPYSNNKVAEYFVAATDELSIVLGVNPELGRPEHHEGRWCAETEAKALLNDRVRRALEWAMKRIGDEDSP